MIELENLRKLWDHLYQIEQRLQQKSAEIERLTHLNMQLEEKLRAKESDLSQARMLFESSQQSFQTEKQEIESQVKSLINRIDQLTGEK
ncbi:MAG: hypothetical protein HUU10_06080 [Bacteroidetes bacterium]|nr:hypothetical protein [Bacteroidota bacterium]